MKQTVLITAYDHPDQLCRLISSLDQAFCVCIHIDQSGGFSESDIALIRAMPNVATVKQTNRNNWGSFGYLESVLQLSRWALENSDSDYFHLISGQDFPALSGSEMSAVLDGSGQTEFIQCTALPAKGWGEDGGMNRFDFFHLNDILNCKSWRGAKWANRFVRLQKFFRLKRRHPKRMPDLYGGSDWWTLSRAALDYLVRFGDENPKILRRFQMTHAPTEIYPHTVLMNSPFRDHISNRALRYVVWEERNGFMPAILDESDFEEIDRLGVFFARKLRSPESDKLLARLQVHSSKST